MFEIGPTPAASDVPDRDTRVRIFRRWTAEYEIEFGEYPSVMGLVVSVSGTPLGVDKIDEFPSEALFANVGLAIHSGAVKKRSGVFPAGAAGKGVDFAALLRRNRK